MGEAVGIKDTVDCMSHLRRVILEVKGQRPDFLVFCGFDEYMLDTLMLGGDGVIPATSNFAPEIACGIYKAFGSGDFAVMKTQLRRLAVLSKIYSIDKPFTGLIKKALRLCGLEISSAVVAPATTPDAAMKLRLKTILWDADVLRD